MNSKLIAKLSDKCFDGNTFDIHKYTELVVKECARICDDGDGSCSSMAENAWKNHCRDEILKHFGIK